ncbi:MAG: type II toxin-antitoxin system VapC family toxin [Spirochaetota bacterium]
MDLLLDTHAVIWWLTDDPKLSVRQRSAIQDKRNTCFVSSATVWEISIKAAIGKLAIEAHYMKQLRSEGFIELPITWDHARAVQELPLHHRDPFDRLLVVQAALEGMSLVSSDENVAKYDVRVVS